MRAARACLVAANRAEESLNDNSVKLHGSDLEIHADSRNVAFGVGVISEPEEQ